MKIFDTKHLRVRKLTPTEYGRLQAFPMENWKQVVSNSQAYKQFGNAVTTTVFTPIATQIAKAIFEAENKQESEELNMDAAVESKEIINTPDGGVYMQDNDKQGFTYHEPPEVKAEENKIEPPEEFEKSHASHVGAEEMADFITETLFNETLVPGILFDKIKNSIMQTLTQEFDGRTIGEPKEDAENWSVADRALNDTLERYAHMGPVGMYGIRILTELKIRMSQEERTPELYNAIMEATRE